MSEAPSQARRRAIAAIICMVIASGLFAGSTTIAKLLGAGALGEPLHPLQISLARYVSGLATVGVVALALRPRLAGANWPLHGGRALLGWLSVSCMFAAASQMPLAEATAISFLSPLVTIALAALFLRERIGPRRWRAIVVVVIGALIVTRPGTEAFQPAALIALAAAAFMGVEVIAIKRLSDTEPPLRILMINNLLGTLFAAVPALYLWKGPESGQWLALYGVGAVMICGQAFFIQAMRLGDASYVTPAFYAALIFATLYDAALFDAAPAWASLFGCAVIAMGVIALSWARPGAEPPAPQASGQPTQR